MGYSTLKKYTVSKSNEHKSSNMASTNEIIIRMNCVKKGIKEGKISDNHLKLVNDLANIALSFPDSSSMPSSSFTDFLYYCQSFCYNFLVFPDKSDYLSLAALTNYTTLNGNIYSISDNIEYTPNTSIDMPYEFYKIEWYTKLFISLRKLLEFYTQVLKDNDYYIFATYLNYFKSKPNYEELLGFLPDFNASMSYKNEYNYILTRNQKAKIARIDNQNVIYQYQDYLIYDESLFFKDFELIITDYQESRYFKDMINRASRILRDNLVNNNFKVKNNLIPLTFDSKYKNDAFAFNILHKQDLFSYNPIDVNRFIIPKPNYIPAELLHIGNCDIGVAPSPYPKNLLYCLYKLSSGDISIIQKFAVLIANCLSAYPVSKKLFVIYTRNDDDTNIIKYFIRSIISNWILNRDDILDNIELREAASDDFRKDIEDMRYMNIKAGFLSHKIKIKRDAAYRLSNLIRSTSNQTNNRHVSNVQLILVQSDKEIGDLPKNDIIEIDLSNTELNQIHVQIAPAEFIWAKFHLALYGYRVIKGTSVKLKQFDTTSEKNQKSYIEGILDSFLNDCFVSPKEAQARADNRKILIKEMKESDPDISAEELTSRLSGIPLFATYNDEFKAWIKRYIQINYSAEELEKHDVNEKSLFNYFKNTPKYCSVYPNKDINILYYDHKKGNAFRYLSLKEPWDSMEAAMIEKKSEIITSETAVHEITNSEIEWLYNVINQFVFKSMLITVCEDDSDD